MASFVTFSWLICLFKWLLYHTSTTPILWETCHRVEIYQIFIKVFVSAFYNAIKVDQVETPEYVSGPLPCSAYNSRSHLPQGHSSPLILLRGLLWRPKSNFSCDIYPTNGMLFAPAPPPSGGYEEYLLGGWFQITSSRDPFLPFPASKYPPLPLAS